MNGRMKGVNEKPEKQCLEINKLSTLTSRKNSLKNAIKMRFSLQSSLTIWHQREDGGGGVNPP